MYQPTHTITIRKIPLQSYLKFKAACALERISVQQKIIDLIVGYVERQDRKAAKADINQ